MFGQGAARCAPRGFRKVYIVRTKILYAGWPLASRCRHAPVETRNRSRAVALKPTRYSHDLPLGLDRLFQRTIIINLKSAWDTYQQPRLHHGYEVCDLSRTLLFCTRHEQPGVSARARGDLMNMFTAIMGAAIVNNAKIEWSSFPANQTGMYRG